jgi:hypothetical protein
MSLVKRLDSEKIIVVAMVLTSLIVAFLLFGDTSAPVGAAPPAARPSHRVADEQVPPVPAEAEQTPPDRTARELAAQSQSPHVATADPLAASDTPETSPASHAGVPHDSEDSPPSASEQSIFKSRKALETVDPREFLRQATMPK